MSTVPVKLGLANGALSAILLVTVVLKFASSPRAAANSFNVSNVAGAESVIAATTVDCVAYPFEERYVPTSESVYPAGTEANDIVPLPSVLMNCPVVPSERANLSIVTALSAIAVVVTLPVSTVVWSNIMTSISAEFSGAVSNVNVVPLVLYVDLF